MTRPGSVDASTGRALNGPHIYTRADARASVLSGESAGDRDACRARSMPAGSRANVVQDCIHRLQRGFRSEDDVVHGTKVFKVVGIDGECEAEQAFVADAGRHVDIFKRIAQEKQVPASGERFGAGPGLVQAVDERRIVRHRIAFRVKVE